MNQNLTEIAFVLDRSGSMQPLVESAISGFNDFLQQQLDTPGDANLSLLLFDDRFELPYDRVALQDVRPLDTTTYVPRGSTALLDAVGNAIMGLGRKLAKEPEDRRPAKVIVAIFTDGEENASIRYTMDKINRMITHQREIYSWEFLFLGATHDAIATAAQLGVAQGMAAQVVADAVGMASTTASMSRKVKAMRKASELGAGDEDLHKPLQDIVAEEDHGRRA